MDYTTFFGLHSEDSRSCRRSRMCILSSVLFILRPIHCNWPVTNREISWLIGRKNASSSFSAWPEQMDQQEKNQGKHHQFHFPNEPRMDPLYISNLTNKNVWQMTTTKRNAVIRLKLCKPKSTCRQWSWKMSKTKMFDSHVRIMLAIARYMLCHWILPQ